MGIFTVIFKRYSHIFFMILPLLFFIFNILSGPVWSQLPNIPALPGFSSFSFPGAILPYPPVAGITRQQISPIIIRREFPPNIVNQENVSFYIQTSSPISIILETVTKNGQLFRLELIPDNGETQLTAQGSSVKIHVGSEKVDGQWHEWELNSLEEIFAGVGRDFSFIAKLEIRGEEFCLGPIVAFSENDEGVIETTYLVSFTDERDNIQDYGLISFAPVKSEYNELIEIETETIEEGYVCLSPGQQSQQSTVPQIPVTFFSAPLGLGPILPVTIFSPTIPNSPFPFVYPPVFQASRLASQLYATPINPGLALSLLQSIPLYLDAQKGSPYSVNNNLLQFYDQFPTYPTRIDYANDPAYVYLGLNNTVNTINTESSGWLVPKPYYP